MSGVRGQSCCWALVGLFVGVACSSNSSPDGTDAGGTQAGGSGSADPCHSLNVGSSAGPRGFSELYNAGSEKAQGLQLSNGYLYFASTKALMRMPVAGGAPEVFASFSGTNTQNGVLSVSGTTAAWGEHNSVARPMRDELYAKSTTSASAPIAQLGTSDYIYYLSVNDSSVFWIGYNSGIMASPVGGGTATTLVTAFSHGHGGLLAAGNFVYYSGGALDPYTDQLMRVPVAGGTPELSAKIALGGAHLFASDDANLYWTDTNNGTLSVSTWRFAGTEAKVLHLTDTYRASDGGGALIAASSGSAYFTAGTQCSDTAEKKYSIWRVTADGSTDALVASGFDSTTGIAVDSQYVYVAVSSDAKGDHIYRFAR